MSVYCPGRPILAQCVFKQSPNGYHLSVTSTCGSLTTAQQFQPRPHTPGEMNTALMNGRESYNRIRRLPTTKPSCVILLPGPIGIPGTNTYISATMHREISAAFLSTCSPPSSLCSRHSSRPLLPCRLAETSVTASSASLHLEPPSVLVKPLTSHTSPWLTTPSQRSIITSSS